MILYVETQQKPVISLCFMFYVIPLCFMFIVLNIFIVQLTLCLADLFIQTITKLQTCKLILFSACISLFESLLISNKMTGPTPKVLVIGDSYIERLADSVYLTSLVHDGLDNSNFSVDLAAFGATINGIKEEMWRVDINVHSIVLCAGRITW